MLTLHLAADVSAYSLLLLRVPYLLLVSDLLGCYLLVNKQLIMLNYKIYIIKKLKFQYIYK